MRFVYLLLLETHGAKLEVRARWYPWVGLWERYLARMLKGDAIMDTSAIDGLLALRESIVGEPCKFPPICSNAWSSAKMLGSSASLIQWCGPQLSMCHTSTKMKPHLSPTWLFVSHRNHTLENKYRIMDTLAQGPSILWWYTARNRVQGREEHTVFADT